MTTDQITPETVRRPARVQGWVLVSTAWLAVMASAVISPILPRILAEFHSTPNATILVSLVATSPALFIALLATPFGLLGDRVGRRRVLLWGVFLYGFLGVAPHWLHSLQTILLTRAGVGIAEAAIITCGTALIGDYFSGGARERWFALQTGSANVVAVIMVALGGLLGEQGWRMSFMMYAFSFLLFPLVLFLTWQPHGEPAITAAARTVSSPPATRQFRWRELLGICLITVFTSTAFYVVVVQLGFLLTERGYTSPKMIGMGMAFATLAMPLGAVLFRFLPARYTTKLALSFVFSSIGFFVIALSHGYYITIAGAAINSVGSGLALPTLISWALRTVPPPMRGRGTGAWQSSFYFGQFASPLMVLALVHSLGSRSRAVLAYAFCCALCAVLFGLLFQRSRKSPALAGIS